MRMRGACDFNIAPSHCLILRKFPHDNSSLHVYAMLLTICGMPHASLRSFCLLSNALPPTCNNHGPRQLPAFSLVFSAQMLNDRLIQLLSIVPSSGVLAP